MKTNIYVDGFNLYHAIDALDLPHLKWLNLFALGEKLIRKDERISQIKYFSAYATWRQSSYRRHQRYVQALEHYGVIAVLGRFKAKSVRCRSCGVVYTAHEEKETDVNIGAHLMADALKGRFQRALVISADTDLIAAVNLARLEAPGTIIDIIAPPKRKNRNSAALFEIGIGKLKGSLLGQEITLADGRKIERPIQYSPPA